MNEKLLKSKMLEYGDTQASLAEALGMQECTLNYKLKSRYEFKRNEIDFIAERYKLTANDIQRIFFSKEV